MADEIDLDEEKLVPNDDVEEGNCSAKEDSESSHRKEEDPTERQIAGEERTNSAEPVTKEEKYHDLLDEAENDEELPTTPLNSSNTMARLIALGYSESDVTKALRVTGDDVDQATGFLNLDESSRAAFVTESNRSNPQESPGFVQVDSTDILVDMGYDREQAHLALEATHGNMDRAVEILMNRDAALQLPSADVERVDDP